MRCVERSARVKLGCVLEESEASWAIAQFSSHALGTADSTPPFGVWHVCAYV